MKTLCRRHCEANAMAFDSRHSTYFGTVAYFGSDRLAFSTPDASEAVGLPDSFSVFVFHKSPPTRAQMRFLMTWANRIAANVTAVDGLVPAATIIFRPSPNRAFVAWHIHTRLALAELREWKFCRFHGSI